MNDVYLSLGSNEGDRVLWLQLAVERLAARCGRVVQSSPVYETAAWGITEQPSFLNMAVHVQTRLAPHELLVEINAIEEELGRQRTVKWGQRTLDIDILLYGNEVISDERLKVPHPFLHERRFTLAPLADIAGGVVHPVLKKIVAVLLAECPDQLEVTVYRSSLSNER